MRFIYLPDTFASRFFINKNYGRLDIRPKTSEVSLKDSVRDINGTEVLRKDYTMTDLSYDKTNFVFPKLCFAIVAKQLNFRFLALKFQQIFMKIDFIN